MLDQNQFILGQLVTGVDNLNKQLAGLTLELTALRRDIEEIKLFRSKVVGASIVISILSSATFTALLTMFEKWAR